MLKSFGIKIHEKNMKLCADETGDSLFVTACKDLKTDDLLCEVPKSALLSRKNSAFGLIEKWLNDGGEKLWGEVKVMLSSGTYPDKMTALEFNNAKANIMDRYKSTILVFFELIQVFLHNCLALPHSNALPGLRERIVAKSKWREYLKLLPTSSIVSLPVNDRNGVIETWLSGTSLDKSRNDDLKDESRELSITFRLTL